MNVERWPEIVNRPAFPLEVAAAASALAAIYAGTRFIWNLIKADYLHQKLLNEIGAKDRK
jgi:hypothetical protein